jgi:hypothetical protein
VKQRQQEDETLDERQGVKDFLDFAKQDEESAARVLDDIDPHLIPAVSTVHGWQAPQRRNMVAKLQDHPVGRRYATRSLSAEATAAVQKAIDQALDDENATVGLARVLRVLKQYDPEPAREAVPLNYDEMRKHLAAVAVDVPEIVEEPKTAQEAWQRGLDAMPLPELEKMMAGERRRAKPEPKDQDQRTVADLEARMKEIAVEERNKVNAVPDFDNDAANGYARFFPTDDSTIRVID